MQGRKNIFKAFYIGFNLCIKSRCSLVYHHKLAIYHQPAGLHIIKRQENARLRVMRYKYGSLSLIIYAAPCASMIYQACGLNKKILAQKNEDFLAGAEGLEPTTHGFGDQYSTN